MRKWRFLRLYRPALVVALIVSIAVPISVAALTSSSENYQMTEIELDGGSTLESCSEVYCARATIGETTEGGKSKGPTTAAAFGSVTPDEPLLEVIVDTGESDLGVLSTETTATKTTTVRIRNYLSNGYVLQIVGDPPKFKNHTLSTPTLPTASAPGNEQFAINVAANTLPAVGANPIQVPSSGTSFGEADDNYSTPNLFKYVDGDVVARSDKESGRTDYTISMIVNVANSTPAGHYTGDFAAVVVPVY